MNPQRLDCLLKARVTRAMYNEFQSRLIEEKRMNDGLKEGDLVRRAIREYLDSKDPKKVRAAKIRATSDEAI